MNRNFLKIFSSILVLSLSLNLFSGEISSNGHRIHQKNQCLKFSKDKQFKILQFTDLHLVPSHPSTPIVWENIRATINYEKPDLIMLTGDQIYCGPGVETYKVLLDTLDKFNIPYALVFGNHDRQFNNTNDELLQEAMKRPNCVASDVPYLKGAGNYHLDIKSSKSDSIKFVLWCLDSGEESPLSKKVIPSYDYDYIRRDQIAWYTKESAKLAKLYNKPIPSIMFMHIPIPEYDYASKAEGAKIYGNAKEKVCCSHVNSGLFCSILENGNVKAIFSGHDHDNDYAVSYYGILLAYGRFSGGKTEYNNLGVNGARVIVLNENEPKIETWIRLRNGEVLQRTIFPDDYEK